jgi:extradiol dioxygenase family protein
MNSSDRTLQHRQVNVVNQSVETLRLMQCALGEEKSLISCFKGVKSVDLFNVTILRRPGVPPANRLLASIEGLESFSYREDVVHWNEPIIGEQMAWISSNISAAPSLRSMDLQLKREHLPYLPSVLVDCPPKLCMQINAGEDVSQLCAGIEAAQSLTSLNLALEDSQISQPSFHSILGSVSNHPGIRHFAFVFRIHLFSWVELEQFLSNNTSVENFELDPTGGDLEPGHVGFKSVIQGLRRNRNLQSITFLVPEFESQNDYVLSYPGQVPVTAEMSELIVSMLEECNTSLKSIEGPFYESRQHEGRIHSLLELNRHGQEFVANLRSVPLGLWGAVVPMDRWGDVFSRISNTDCNFFVTKLVRQAMCGDQMEPRGIGAGDPNSGTNARTN